MVDLKGIPKKYHSSIRDFYKDEDGWWMILKQDGQYVLDGYCAEYTIHEDTKAEVLYALMTFVVKRRD